MDRALHTQRRDESRRSHCSQKGGRLPASVGNSRDQSRASPAAAIGPGQIGLGPGLIEEDDYVGVYRQLLGSPAAAGLRNVFARLLDREQRLFFASVVARDRRGSA